MRILLVEDDERIADSLAEALSDQHYVVDIAADGQIGWEFVKSFTYNLLVLDLMLPKIDGISIYHLYFNAFGELIKRDRLKQKD